MNRSQLPNELNRLTHEYEVELNYSTRYFTIVSLVNNNTIWWKGSTSTYKTISISLDNGNTWTSVTSASSGVTLATLSANQTMLVKGSNTAYGNSSGYNYFISTGNFNVEGNIMSLIYGDDFIKETFLTISGYNFKQLFNGCTYLIDASNLILPTTAIILASNCYYGMFQDCTSLTKAPKLPATTLSTNCYSSMFSGCTSLIKAPELPATTLDYGCYESMFAGCTSLTKAPELPATTLAGACYESMFYGCTSLTKAPELPATTLVNFCYESMFYGCTSLTKVPDLPATTLANYCYASMFYNCTSLTEAPNLPATTLADACYYRMFYGCTNLSYIKCLATNISASNCLSYWVQNVASTGIFVKTDSISSWSTGTSGKPNGWEEYKNSEYEVVRHYELTNLIEKHDYSQDYLTIVSLVDNNTIGWRATSSNLTKTISISLDNGATWTSVTSTTSGATLATLSTNQKMLIKGSNTAYGNSAYYNYFTSTGNFNVEGNIMSLVASDNFIGQTSLDSSGFNFFSLFEACRLIDASNLILPATTLTTYCYSKMFYYCISLTKTPELPATILTESCYEAMFFSCTSLNYIKCLATDISASDCLKDWTSDVAPIGIFIYSDNININNFLNNLGQNLSNWLKLPESYYKENMKNGMMAINSLSKYIAPSLSLGYVISPNIEYFLQPVTSTIKIVLDIPKQNLSNEYKFQFDISSSNSNPTIYMPSYINWLSGDITFKSGAHYEINIKYNSTEDTYYGICLDYCGS